MDEVHDFTNCEDCSFQEFAANGHEMQMVVPCNDRAAHWTCTTCEIIERWPVEGDVEAINEIMNAMLWIHCIDNLIYQ